LTDVFMMPQLQVPRAALPPNAKAQQPGGLLERHVVESRNGRPVCCSDLFGAASCVLAPV
jgi:hypothetical protein